MTQRAGGAEERWAHEMSVEVVFRDLDALGHLNHSLPIRYMEDVRTAYYMRITGLADPRELDMILAEVTCTYHAPAGFAERLRVGVRPEAVGAKSFTLVYRVWSQDSGQTIATGRSVMVSYDYAAGRTKPVPDAVRQAFAPWLAPTTE